MDADLIKVNFDLIHVRPRPVFKNFSRALASILLLYSSICTISQGPLCLVVFVLPALCSFNLLSGTAAIPT